MSRKLPASFFLLAILLFSTTGAQAESPVYFGIGLHTASFGGDLRPGTWVAIMPGPGVALNIGFNMSSKLALDVRAGRTFQRERFSNSRVNYDWVEVGPILYLTGLTKIRPFVSAGVGTYKIKTTGIDLEGTGIFASAGVEDSVSENLSAKLYVQGSRWEDTDFDLEVEAFNVGLIFNFTL